MADYAADLDPDAQPLGIERWVSVATGRIVAEGRVDRIDERGGELVIVDYKTGRHALTADDARRSQALALYAVAARRALRRACRRVELHHLPSGEVLAWEHDAASLVEHVDRAEATAVAAAEAADALAAGADPEATFPPRPAPRCSTCDVRRHCPEGRAAGPETGPVGTAGAVTDTRPRRMLRGVSGVLAGGLVGLVVVLAVAWFVATRIGSPGPGSGRSPGTRWPRSRPWRLSGRRTGARTAWVRSPRWW